MSAPAQDGRAGARFPADHSPYSVPWVYGYLGRPKRQSIVHASGTPLLHESAWPCGCVITYVDHRRVIEWAKCGAHG